MDYVEAKETFLSRNNQTLMVFPYGPEYQDEEFLEAEIPLSYLRDYNIDDLYSSLMQEVEMDPIWIKTCKKKLEGLHPYWDRKFTVVDGNHRVSSARDLGRTHIKAVMPESHYHFWRNLNAENS